MGSTTVGGKLKAHGAVRIGVGLQGLLALRAAQPRLNRHPSERGKCDAAHANQRGSSLPRAVVLPRGLNRHRGVGGISDEPTHGALPEAQIGLIALTSASTGKGPTPGSVRGQRHGASLSDLSYREDRHRTTVPSLQGRVFQQDRGPIGGTDHGVHAIERPELRPSQCVVRGLPGELRHGVTRARFGQLRHHKALVHSAALNAQAHREDVGDRGPCVTT